MTCPHCAIESGQFDKTRFCCAVRFVEQTTRDDADRLLTQTAHKYGHDRKALKAAVIAARKAAGEVAR